MHAWRSHARHRVRQRSSRVYVLFLLAVASLHRVRHRSSSVVVASRRLLSAAAAIYNFRDIVLFFVFSTYCTKIRSGPVAISDWLSCSRGGGCTTQAGRSLNLCISPEEDSAESPLGGGFVVNSEPHTGERPSVRLCVGLSTGPIGSKQKGIG
jgi:hypothetical protein